MKLLTPSLIKRFAQVGSQGYSKDPIIIAKFFNPCGSGTWYATEYNLKDHLFFGYVTGLGYDEWGSFSLKELESLKLPFDLRIERDLFFDEFVVSEIIEGKSY